MRTRQRRKNGYERFATIGLAASVLFVMPAFASSNGPKHAPIVIQNDTDFATCACVVSGTGTAGDPYVIGPWSINGAGGDAVIVDGTNVTQSFTLSNLTIAGNGAATSRGIVLRNVKTIATVSGSSTSVQTTGIGIVVENSSGVTLDGGGANPNGPGIRNQGAGTINKNTNGAIDVEHSDHVTIRGWQMSANGSDILPNWVTLDPSVAFWGVGGIRFFGVTYSVIDHNAANNDTSVSYSLLNSSYNMVTNNTGDYPLTMNFLLTAGSSYNTLSGNVAGTGDFLGYMVADALPGNGILETYGSTHDNILQGNVSHTDGPTGNELKANVAPAFLGGIVVLNGAYNNTIENNQVWGSTGPGLGWAQAVPDSAAPIGVVTYPPSLQCNVTLSSGGGGVANLNGNVWRGNMAKTIVPCIPPQ